MLREQDARYGFTARSNAHLQQLVTTGVTRLSVAFDLPTRLGWDSDAPPARGEVGRAGATVDSVDDMRVLFRGIPLEGISTSLTAGVSAAPLLLMYQLVGEEQGVLPGRLAGVVRHCEPPQPHRGFPPGPARRLAGDLHAYCAAELPGWDVRGAAEPPSASGREPDTRLDPAIEARQRERLAKLRAWRVRERVDAALTDVRKAAEGTANVLHPIKDALRTGSTLGEVCAVLRAVWG
ncbi:methylmalonyl-CoA mutase family protein [Streptomyces virginiae]|uniref:methylmalonyl-CoA mutase family protein n=1 Tax=Streptomyces virginiae TaxID=1961 RepID=UPI0035DFA88D